MKKPQKLGRAALVVALAVAFAAPLALLGCGASDEPASGDEPAAEQAAPEEEADYAVTIDGSEMTKDYEGNPAMIVDFTFTNNSDDATSFAAACSQNAFQNGVELEMAITADDLGNGYMAEVKPGASTTARLAYVLSDESDVSVEVTELFSLDDTMLAEATFSVA